MNNRANDFFLDDEKRAFTSLDDPIAKRIMAKRESMAKQEFMAKQESMDNPLQDTNQVIRTKQLEQRLNATFDNHELQKTIIAKTDLDDALAGNYHLETLTENKTVNILSILDLDVEQTRMMINPASRERKAYILLDSKTRDSITNDRTSITWNFMNNADIRSGSTNALGFISDVTSFHIYDFYMNVIDSNYQCDQMIFTVLIQEFTSQAFIAPESRRFHFWGKMLTDNEVVTAPTYLIQFHNGADVVGNLEYLYRLQDGNDGLFKFRTPIKTLNTFTLSFGAPYTKIPLHQDTYQFSYISGGVGSFIVTLAAAHDIPIGVTDRVYISDFNTDDPVADADLISLLNSPPNNIVYVGTSINSTQLTITPPNNVIINLTFNALVGTQISGQIYLDYYRIYVPIEITYLSPTNDL